MVPRVGDPGQDAVLGEECHIVSRQTGGPRGADVLDPPDFDAYRNLILLCATDHSLVDQLPELFRSKDLQEMKATHEKWVQDRLDPEPANLAIHRALPQLLVEVPDGQTLIWVVAGAEESSLDHDDLESREEVQLVGQFLQMVHDYGEIWDDMEPGGRVEATFELSQALAGLNVAGWRVFGGRGVGYLTGGQMGSARSEWVTACLKVVRSTSDEIVQANGSLDALERQGTSGQ